MDESTYRLLDTVVKLLAWLSVACGGGWALVRHVAQARRDSEKPFRDQQVRLYLETAEVVGAIAAREPSSERELLEIKFWTLYYGAFAAVQEKEVTDSLVIFARALRKGRAKTTLRENSLAFANACRRAIEQTWKVKLLPLGPKYEPDLE